MSGDRLAPSEDARRPAARRGLEESLVREVAARHPHGGFKSGAVAESDEDAPGLVLDYDEGGNPLSVEVLDASSRVERPESVTLAAES